ncbi:HEAT repeat domain-containing protein [Pseudomonas sp. 7P_10.2_Bac1]|uniref:HEAT repeat domain-containing protein n=1 Tax=Pseudomonas sp. 7P_10.2_Bac1 TaxID=2971614 RepID=UPI0021C6047F|nr:HEAT repeat domain-containing protein [Pseudomonas sp. 7P_10.2_Bac1]MCU1729652.1 HEAT repeat domain-containing protein [Pseudomonas sp. 7P_10.2_Bac1]
MISKWLFSLALLLEAGSGYLLWAQLSPGQSLALYLLVHTCASAMLSAAVWGLLPSRYRTPLPWSPLFLFSLAYFIPLVGALGLACAIFPALYLPRARDQQAWQALGIPKLPFRSQPLHSPIFRDGGLQDVLRHSADPDLRLSALLSTRRMPGKEAIPILKLALADPSDDVRLLAYSMLDKQENTINQRIQADLEQLAKASPAGCAALHATLARWYWELAYLGLAQGSVLEHVLGQARDHAEQGLREGEGGELHLLAGRIALELGDLNRAQTHLQTAEIIGIDATLLIPFHAEIAFRAGRYQEIPQRLAALPPPMLRRPPFAELARCWL